MSKATEAMKVVNKTHGHAHRGSPTKEYRSWRAMLARCYTQSNKEFLRYGGRGITVCPEWINDFSQFLSDVGPAPSQAHTLDRKNSNLHYSPANCQWATRLEQVRNRRNTVFYEGKTMAEWAIIHGLNYHTLMDRWRAGDRGDHLFRKTKIVKRRQ